MTGGTALPDHIGPVQLEAVGRLVRVRAPGDYAAILQRAGARWDRGSRAWWLERRRLGPVIRKLQAAVDPLFAAAGLSVDGGMEEGHAERRTRGA